MSVINSIPLIAAGDDGYQISRSVRLRSSASGYFNRTLGTPTNSYKYTWSGWVKRGSLGGSQYLLSGYSGNSDAAYGVLYFTSSNNLVFTGFNTGWRQTNQVFRDPSSWYHIVLSVDTTQATASNRIKIYVNGVEVTSFSVSNNPSQNSNTGINTATTHYQGADIYGGPVGFVDGYLTEVNFIDGQALTPSSFGETDTITGVWKPKKYAGTYGTNGFYLNFSDNSAATAAAIGKDSSGNGNNWTPNNISVTAGITYDSMTDVPTMSAAGSNHCVLNPLDSYSTTLSKGNLSLSAPNGNSWVDATIALPSSDKFYWEYTCTNTQGSTGRDCVGFALQTLAKSGYFAQTSNSGGYLGLSGGISGFTGTGGNVWGNGDVIGVCVDCATGNVWYTKNGTVQNGSPTAGTSPAFTLAAPVTQWVPAFGPVSNAVGYGMAGDVNFGQRPFAYTPPTGFKALNTQNLPAVTINNGAQYMAATLWTGAGQTGAGSITGVGFQPDLVWAKSRSAGNSHALFNSIVGGGANKGLSSNSTASEASFNDDATYGYLTSFDSNGFSYYGGSSPAYFSANAATYVAWSWKAAGSAVSNTDGTITSQVNAGTTQGFSVVTYTGTGANATVGHGLGVAPKMVIVKRRSSTGNWLVWNYSVASTASDRVLFLDTTDAQTAATTNFNGTFPTSSVFSVGTNAATNASAGTYVAYCWSEVAGFSKFGSYTGNGSADGPFVFCGFRPAFVMIKCTSAAEQWAIKDTARVPFNTNNAQLFANSSSAEDVNNTFHMIDFNSNGFKIRGAAQDLVNGSGRSYIFMAFSEVGFKYALGR